MLQHLIKLNHSPDLLDITDALAVAVCHYFQSSGAHHTGVASYNNWAAFVASNPGKVSS